jgi:hypothetical protein
MKARFELSAEDLSGILSAVFEYNGLSPLRVEYLDAEGQPIVLEKAVVECELPGLRVRVAPDDCQSPEEAARFFSKLEV